MSKHQKSLSSPKTYPIPRKERPWAIKPSPGPHSQDNCVPLGIIIRDVLNYAESVSEVKRILKKGNCEVDGKRVSDHRFPVGIFDSLKFGDEFFRVVPSKRGFKLVGISEKDSKEKICRLEDKKIIKDGDLQLTFNDGKTFLDREDEFMDVDTGSSVVISLPDLEIVELIELDKDQDIMITEGKNRGEVAQFKKKKNLKGSNENRVIVSQENKELDLPESLVFPIDTDIIKGDSEEE